jgi:hypothetical protein
MQLKRSLALALLLSFMSLMSAQTSKPPQSTKAAAPADTKQDTKQDANPDEKQDENQDILQAVDASNAEVQAKRQLAEASLATAKAQYQTWSLKHAKDAYEWQHISTMIIFVVVILLMVAGVVFSWIQFRQGMHHPVQAIASSVSTIAQPASTSADSTQAPSEVAIEKSSVTEFSASPQGIKVASSTLGVIILVISMCFFYMYLVYVYPINIQNANQALSAAQKVSGK